MKEVYSLSASEQQGASEYTKKANEIFLNTSPMDWNSVEDFENAERGFIDCDDPVVIRDENGKIIQDLRWYKEHMKSAQDYPETVNPSLWRHGVLNTSAGLFKVCDSVYQVRGYDISNMTIVEGETGYILMDVLMKNNTARAALKLVFAALGRKPVKAIIIGHSHSDHYGGIDGVFEEIGEENIPILAPVLFEEAALNENVLAGNAMQKRAETQFGFTLPVGIQGTMDGGLGKRGPSGISSYAQPTDHITRTGEARVYDGVEFVFQLTPETEAPATMQVYIPVHKLLWVGEVVNQTDHNLCPIRGALTRDALVWSTYIDEMLYLFPETEIAAGSHFWPVWGHDKVVELLKAQRDLYKYTHDQTMHLANLGYTGSEIANMIHLPQCLGRFWSSRDYYGNLSFNARSIYTRYLGWYEGNPVYLKPLPRKTLAENMLPLLGGIKKAIEAAKDAFDRGEYQWVLQLLDYVIAAEQENMEARCIMAAACEQLGYQQETATWRNAYLAAAKELREGNQNGAVKKTVKSYLQMDMENLLKFISIQFDGLRAESFEMNIDWYVEDLAQHFFIDVANCVVHYHTFRTSDVTNARVTSDKAGFIRFLVLHEDLENMEAEGAIKVDGDRNTLLTFQYLLSEFRSDFNLVLR